MQKEIQISLQGSLTLLVGHSNDRLTEINLLSLSTQVHTVHMNKTETVKTDSNWKKRKQLHQISQCHSIQFPIHISTWFFLPVPHVQYVRPDIIPVVVVVVLFLLSPPLGISGLVWDPGLAIHSQERWRDAWKRKKIICAFCTAAVLLIIKMSSY